MDRVLSHVEELRRLRVVKVVLLLVVFLQLGCVAVPALLRCVHAGVGVLSGLGREGQMEAMEATGREEVVRAQVSQRKSTVFIYLFHVQLGGVHVVFDFFRLLRGFIGLGPLLGETLLGLWRQRQRHVVT